MRPPAGLLAWRPDMRTRSKEVVAGQAVYTRRTLAVYDAVVHGFSNRFLWKCPAARLEDQYNRHASANHLDVGVGTGYFLDRCQFPSPAPRIGLMDLNAEALAFASRRIARFRPVTYQRNVLEPVSIEGAAFDSVSLTYVLHCLPGSMEEKAAVFDHLKSLMNPGAVLFGATLLQGGVRRNFWARRLMACYNRSGVFSNEHDSVEGLTRELARRLGEVRVEVEGCAALFSGRRV